MKLEDQVCSLELSKKLKELGVTQESYFWWGTHLGEFDWSVWDDRFPNDDSISAFTVAELGEMLPKLSKCWNNARGDTWICDYMEPLRPDNMKYFTRIGVESKTEADARAKMLIYLLENKIIEVRG